MVFGFTPDSLYQIDAVRGGGDRIRLGFGAAGGGPFLNHAALRIEAAEVAALVVGIVELAVGGDGNTARAGVLRQRVFRYGQRGGIDAADTVAPELAEKGNPRGSTAMP